MKFVLRHEAAESDALLIERPRAPPPPKSRASGNALPDGEATSELGPEFVPGIYETPWAKGSMDSSPGVPTFPFDTRELSDVLLDFFSIWRYTCRVHGRQR